MAKVALYMSKKLVILHRDVSLEGKNQGNTEQIGQEVLTLFLPNGLTCRVNRKTYWDAKGSTVSLSQSGQFLYEFAFNLLLGVFILPFLTESRL